MANNPLSPQNILQGMADALPTHEKSDTTSDMSSSAEAIALFAHSCMVNLGFRLLGFNEDQKMGAQLHPTPPQPILNTKLTLTRVRMCFPCASPPY